MFSDNTEVGNITFYYFSCNLIGLDASHDSVMLSDILPVIPSIHFSGALIICIF